MWYELVLVCVLPQNSLHSFSTLCLYVYIIMCIISDKRRQIYITDQMFYAIILKIRLGLWRTRAITKRFLYVYVYFLLCYWYWKWNVILYIDGSAEFRGNRTFPDVCNNWNSCCRIESNGLSRIISFNHVMYMNYLKV